MVGFEIHHTNTPSTLQKLGPGHVFNVRAFPPYTLVLLCAVKDAAPVFYKMTDYGSRSFGVYKLVYFDRALAFFSDTE